MNHIFVVGSMLDFALLDYNERGNTRNLDFNKVLSITVKSLRENASEQIKNYFSDKYNVAEKLKDSLPPKFISSMFYRAGICKKNNLDYPPDVNDAINNMKEKFYNFDESYKNLFTLAGIDSIKLKCLIPIIEEKDKIIETKINEYTDVKIAQVLRELEDINIILTNNLDKIENADIRGLEEEKENIIKKLNSLRIRIQSTFDSVNTDSKKYINLIKDRIHKEMFNFEELKEDVHKYNKQEKRKTGIFGLKTEYYNITITEKTVALSEVSNNFSKYANKCYKIINDEFNKLFDIQELRRSIKGIVVDIVDKKSKNFNENDIIMPIENALKKITIPEIKIEYKKYIDEIVNVFSSSGLLKGNDVADLKFQYSRLLDSMREDIQNNLDTINKKIENNLNIISSNFVDEISKDLENNINNIIKSLGNKEKAIEEYKKYIDIVKKSKALLNEIN
ncbi:hypothetical protein EPJ72_03125 [Brachyspira pilosicoli]|uniref:Uncharacterized protein n=2 Tax=Brachyspira pilosicoli TaxID=52584 RepID=A0A5C8F5M3_BRAPL|nr:hypothetical protein EPJ72_03125 [Brachyspira pilosicoli]